MKTYNHLCYEDRKNIEDGLNENKSINQIAKELNRNHSNLDLSCNRLKHSPYVCNGYKSRCGCRKIRWNYYAKESQKEYEKLEKKEKF